MTFSFSEIQTRDSAEDKRKEKESPGVYVTVDSLPDFDTEEQGNGGENWASS